MQFRIFVYGTLKQGQRNFARYCRGLLSIEPAFVLGRLHYLSHGHHLSYGYPMLEVPAEGILALGTRDYANDAALLEKMAKCPPHSEIVASQDWEPISGEVHTFDDPQRFAELDELEDFQPGGESLYHRVVVRLQPPCAGLVWTYVAAGGRLPDDAQRIGPCWPE